MLNHSPSKSNCMANRWNEVSQLEGHVGTIVPGEGVNESDNAAHVNRRKYKKHTWINLMEYDAHAIPIRWKHTSWFWIVHCQHACIRCDAHWLVQLYYILMHSGCFRWDNRKIHRTESNAFCTCLILCCLQILNGWKVGQAIRKGATKAVTT